jgi:Cu/Ag efflux protein CusF
MHRWATMAAALWVTVMLWSGSALAQAKPPCDAQGRVTTPQKVDAQVTKVDAAQSKVTVREANGTLHEFQASKEMLQDLKVGDRIEANLREAPKCP